MNVSSASVTEMGDDTSICQDSETLVMVNHQSTGDVPILMNFLLGQGNAAYRTMWILDKMFKFTQFGLVSQVRGDFFIGQVSECYSEAQDRLWKRRFFNSCHARSIFICLQTNLKPNKMSLKYFYATQTCVPCFFFSCGRGWHFEFNHKILRKFFNEQQGCLTLSFIWPVIFFTRTLNFIPHYQHSK